MSLSSSPDPTSPISPISTSSQSPSVRRRRMFSSRKSTSDYRLVDPERGGSGRRYGPSAGGWKKWAIGGVFFLGAVVLIGSRGRRSESSGAVGEADEAFDTDPFNQALPPRPLPVDDYNPADEPSAQRPSSPDTNPLIDVVPENTGASPASPSDSTNPATSSSSFPVFSAESSSFPSSNHPTSFATDPDASSTTYCTTPVSADKPLVQYAIMIDAGSTGSRIHAYKFNNCEPSPQLEYETFKMVQGGLSEYAGDPQGAAKSLDTLLDEAVKVVPKQLQSCTPIAVKATAGLRLLGEEQAGEILKEVRRHIEEDYPFHVPEGEDSVAVMHGRDEGVYAWITVNYLLKRIGSSAQSTTPSVAVMDLGGASTQIVFEPSLPPSQPLVEGEHKYTLTFDNRDYTLYQHSYLGYGLMQARRSVNNLVAFMWQFGNRAAPAWDDWSDATMIPNPCIPSGMEKTVELDPPGKNKVNASMTGSATGWEACNRVVELVMAKDAICEVQPCSFNGVYQPSLMDSFEGPLLALSYFYDRLAPLGVPTPFTRGDLQKLAADVCAGPKRWEARWGDRKEAMKELKDRPEFCLDVTFMNALLGLGYELGPQRELGVGKKIEGVELGWCLGAGIALMDSAQLTCVA